MDFARASIALHKEHGGKLAVIPTVPLVTKEDLSLAYTPGVAAVCEAIHEDKARAYDLTIKGKSVAVVTDGSSVLGLGNIGPEAALPVMEGKSALFKEFGNIDAYPICLATQDPEEIIAIVKAIAPGFAGINLEDIAAPACFEIERRLRNELTIPVVHDDQHGTAIVILAGLLNALRVTGKTMDAISVVISGAGAAGLAGAELLLASGVKHMSMVDSKGIIAKGREGMNAYKDTLATRINPEGKTGSLQEALRGADVFIGVSRPNMLTREDIQTMAKDSIIFAMSNPIPEIMPDEARAGGAKVVATGRSDFPNQVNNVLAFPGLFKGLIAGRKTRVGTEDFTRAAQALAAMVQEPNADHILPSALDRTVAEVVARAVR